MSEAIEIKFPTGRLVGGSLYKGRTTDAQGEKLLFKTGANAGGDRTDFYFGVAIEKKTETHWNQTEWGRVIWGVAHTEFKAAADSPHFAWKVTDGDSTIPNKAGNAPAQRQGYKGHWVLNFAGTNRPKVVKTDGTLLLDDSYVNLGDYVRVLGSVKDNRPAPTPGIYLNYAFVAFRARGETIAYGVDPTSINFGDDALPIGASTTPVDKPMMSPTDVKPHHDILKPPMRQMTEKAQGNSYETLIANGWTDELLVQHGMMEG